MSAHIELPLHCNFRYYPPQVLTGRRVRKDKGSLAYRIEGGEEFELDWKEARPPVVSNPNQSQYFQDLCSKLSSLSGTDRQGCITALLEASTAKVVVCFRLPLGIVDCLHAHPRCIVLLRRSIFRRGVFWACARNVWKPTCALGSGKQLQGRL